MGDSEAVVTQTSASMEYPSTVHTPSDYNHVTSNAIPDDGASVPEPVDATSSAISTDATYAMSDGCNVGDRSTYIADPNIVMQEAPVTLTEDDGKPTSVVDTSENNVNQENLVLGSSQAGLSDSSVNGNGPTIKDVNGNALHGSGGDVGEQHFEGGSAVSTEEERLWSIVKANSLEFNAWTALIEETEKSSEDNILKIRKVYDAFLAEFPLCYGYWKKYADHEARLGSVDKVVEVYERAVESVTYSVDIWLHYCVFAMSSYEDPETVRRLFERGLAYVGTDYLSYPLWDKFIEYEYSQQEWCRLAVIYTRILESPNQQLDRYFASFKELAGSRPLSEIRTAEEVSAVQVGGQGGEGEVHPDDPEDSVKPVTGLTEVEELEKYVAVREEMYRQAKEYDSKIIGFETAIRRPYFHVRPLISSELENWHNYLDFIGGDDFNKLSHIAALYALLAIALDHATFKTGKMNY